MQTIRRVAFLLLAVAAGASAQSFPTRPLHVIVPFPPGGIDTVARLLAVPVGEALGQPVVVENRAGANGMIGSELVARAAPDGHTLLFATSSTLVSGVLLMKKPPVDTMRDFTPVSITYGGMQVLAVTSAVPATTLKQFVDYAKQHPGKLNYSTSGIGSVFHFYALALKDAAGVDMVHVPYKGTGPSLQALVVGEVQVGFPSMQGILPYVQKGTHRILAIVADARNRHAPDVPAINEVLPNFEKPPSWIGVLAPAKLPPPVLARLSTEFVKAANTPKVKAYMDQGGNELIASTHEQALATIRKDLELTARAIKAAGLIPE
jgi:tripartite-type tricarboxylate transporter receptor subunit TctC